MEAPVLRSRFIPRGMVLSLMVSILLFSGAFPVLAARQPAPQHANSVINDLIYDVSFNLDSPNILRTSQNLTFNFKYTSNHPGGIRVFGRPVTGGSLTPNYSAHGSPIYPNGTGAGSGYFNVLSVTGGQTVVDGIRFQITNADQSVLLYETVLPVYYLVTDSPDVAHALDLQPSSANVLDLNQNVTFPFQYADTNPGGVRIFGRPLTGGSPSPNYAAHGSPLYPVGTGSSSGYFTIVSGAPLLVDGLRFQVSNPAQTILLFEAALPVHYLYDNGPDMISNVHFSQSSPNILLYGEDLNLTFDYKTNHPGGVRIFTRPLSKGSLTPGYGASGSSIYPVGSGSGSGFFTITSGPALVDGVRFQVTNADQSLLLYEVVIPVHYQFGPYRPPYNVFIPVVSR